MELFLPFALPRTISLKKTNKEFDWENEDASFILDGVRKLSSYNYRRISHIHDAFARLIYK
jgi:hypothetical protein